MIDARDIDCPKCAKSGDDCGEHSPSWEELVDYWRNEAASLRKQLDDAREALRFYANLPCNLEFGVVNECPYDDGATARAALGPLPAPPSEKE